MTDILQTLEEQKKLEKNEVWNFIIITFILFHFYQLNIAVISFQTLYDTFNSVNENASKIAVFIEIEVIYCWLQ